MCCRRAGSEIPARGTVDAAMIGAMARFGDVHVNNHEHLSSVPSPIWKASRKRPGGATASQGRAWLHRGSANYATPHPVNTTVSRGPIAAASGLICLVCVYIFVPLISWLRRRLVDRRQHVVPVVAR